MKTFSDYGIEIPMEATGHSRALCPECSASRQKSTDKCLSVDIKNRVWLCHHCGWSGGLKGESAEHIRKVFIKPEYRAKADLPKNVIDWFASRGISERILSLNKIGHGPSFKGKNGIQFPYFKGGQVVNVKHRTHDKQFRQEKNAEKCLYRFDAVAKQDGGVLVITEGEIDALSVQEVGHNAVCSIPDGAPSADSKSFQTKFDFLKSADEIISGYEKIILAVDNDPPGRLAEKELARRIGIEKCYRVVYPAGCKDANEVLANHGKAALLNVITNAKPYPIEGVINPNDLTPDVMSLYDRGIDRGVPTGWLHVDPLYTVKPCQMSVITGIPGSGKSEWLDALMMNLAGLHGWKFGVFSPENWPTEQHVKKLIEKYQSKPFSVDRAHIQRMTREDAEESIPFIDRHFKFIVPEDEFLSVDTILEKARSLIFRHGINGLTIDPWNEVEHCFGKLTETQYISQELSKLRRFSRKNGIHIWVVAHPRNLSKDADGNYRAPTMYEISGGAHWRNKADNGICVHRPDYRVDETKIIVQKIRFKEVGQIGETVLKYCRDTGCYDD